MFRICGGKVILTMVGAAGREATMAILGPGDFFGETCLMEPGARRTTSAGALTDCSVTRLEREAALRRLREDSAFSEDFTRYLLMRNSHYESDLSDQLLYSSEKRLARLLLKLCRTADQTGGTAVFSPKLTHETLAEMIGTTRPRVSFFMHRFRKLGLIEYDHDLVIHAGRLAEFIACDSASAPSLESTPVLASQ
jgi:CRP/FNR family cyclic AMP-dependent transcriptional regulator